MQQSPRRTPLRALAWALFFGVGLIAWAMTTYWDPVSETERGNLEALLPDRVWLRSRGSESQISAELDLTGVAPAAGAAVLEDFRVQLMHAATRSPSGSTFVLSVTGVLVRGPYVTTSYGSTRQFMRDYDLTGEVSDVEGEIWFEAVRR